MIELLNDILPAGLQADRLSDNHPLRRQIITILDGLEAVTNGVYNPECGQALLEIPEDSPFFAWRLLVAAIECLYHGDVREMTACLARIPTHSPPAGISALLYELCATDPGTRELGRAERELRRRLLREREGEADPAELISQALQSGRDDILADEVASLIREHAARRPIEARRCALWAIQTFFVHGFPTDLLVSHLRLIFGIAETARLSALAHTRENPHQALLDWAVYLCEAADTLSREELSVVLEAAEATARRCGPQTLHAARGLWNESISRMFVLLRMVWRIDDSIDTLGLIDRAALLIGGHRASCARCADSMPDDVPCERPHRFARQLELFADLD